MCLKPFFLAVKTYFILTQISKANNTPSIRELKYVLSFGLVHCLLCLCPPTFNCNFLCTWIVAAVTDGIGLDSFCDCHTWLICILSCNPAATRHMSPCQACAWEECVLVCHGVITQG